MNKKVFGRKLSRSRPAREALFASISRSIILNGKIDTTRAKAKAVQGSLEKMVTMAKKGDLNSRRIILSNLDNAKDALEALFTKVAPAFTKRNSGFTRIVALSPRRGDNAKMVRIEWTEKMIEKEKAKNEKVEEKPVKTVKKAKKTAK